MAHWLKLEENPIRITAQGDWLAGGTPLNPRVRDLFAQHLVPGLDGAYAIEMGRARQPIEVDDTAVVVKSFTEEGLDGPGGLTIHTSDGREETLDPTTLMQSSDNVLYCRVTRHGLKVPCRFAAGQYHELALRAEPEGDAFVLPLNGKKWPIHPYDARPTPA